MQREKETACAAISLTQPCQACAWLTKLAAKCLATQHRGPHGSAPEGQSSGPGAVATAEVTLAKQAHGSPQGNATPSHTQLQRRTAVPTARVQMPDGPSGLATSNKAWTSPDGPSQMFIRSPGEIFEHMIGLNLIAPS